MLDTRIRRLVDPVLSDLARRLVGRGIAADHVTIAGFLVGLTAAIAIAVGAAWLALVLFAANRLADGLDGAIARLTAKTDRGGFLDITLDFAIYAAVPFAFAVNDPAANALAAAALLASFLVNGVAFLAFALMAERRGLALVSSGERSLFFLAGLAEGTETVVVLAAMCLFPAAFAWLAWGFATLCLASAVARIGLGWRLLS